MTQEYCNENMLRRYFDKQYNRCFQIIFSFNEKIPDGDENVTIDNNI